MVIYISEGFPYIYRYFRECFHYVISLLGPSSWHLSTGNYSNRQYFFPTLEWVQSFTYKTFRGLHTHPSPPNIIKKVNILSYVIYVKSFYMLRRDESLHYWTNKHPNTEVIYTFIFVYYHKIKAGLIKWTHYNLLFIQNRFRNVWNF